MFSKAVAVALDQSEFEEQQSECIACVRMVELLQEKISAASDRDTVVWFLTTAPDTWSISKTVEKCLKLPNML